MLAALVHCQVALLGIAGKKASVMQRFLWPAAGRHYYFHHANRGQQTTWYY
jgi:hypothetical protein